ncbi:MAG TPA: hypothetical protein PKJ77_04990 [Thermodesulfobacteriota bacterium]|nr:hypothetical protein [Thermodesulfobacteriota bacterium]HOC38611.1 hypothetical protein [Thermodesulfobacteriota bacterium]
MKKAGLGVVGLLLTTLFVAILIATAIKINDIYSSRNTPNDTSAKTSSENPVKKARSVECLLKAKTLATDIQAYRIEHDRFPDFLDEITDDYACPLVGDDYEYDPETGEIWCPVHGRSPGSETGIVE